jgi:hypothetical protein
MSKLYTEEQMIQSYELGRGLTHEEVMERFIPIQLPTDEDIYELAKEQYPISMEKFGNEMMDGNIYFRSIFIQGVEWMRDKIKGGDK